MAARLAVEVVLPQTDRIGGLYMIEYRRVRLYSGRFHHYDDEVWLHQYQYHHQQHSSRGGSEVGMAVRLAVEVVLTQTNRIGGFCMIKY